MTTPRRRERTAPPRRLRGLLVALSGAAGISGCGDGGSSVAGPADLALPSAPTWRNVHLRVFAGCHGEGCHELTPPMNVDDRATLVNVPSAANPARLRVVPLQPDASFLYRKLTANLGPGEGDPMPPLGFLLPPDDVQVVRAWIAAGAPGD